MPRIITPESNKKLKREYRLRFLITLLLAASTVIALTAVLLLPSYVLLDSYESAYENFKTSSEQESLERLNQEYASKLENVHVLSQKILRTEPQHTEVLDTLFEYAGAITFNAIELSNAEDVVTVVVRGQAPSRTDLLAFDERMQGDNRFSGFELPIDVLTKQSDSAFNVTFTYDQK